MISITGGAGCIGPHTCAALSEAGHDVMIPDNLFNTSFPESMLGQSLHLGILRACIERNVLNGFSTQHFLMFAYT